MKRAAIEKTYIPKFCDNRTLEENEQVTVEMGFATITEKDIFSKMTFKKGNNVEIQKNEYKALRKKVSKINNYFDESGNPIDTPDKLIKDLEDGSPESNLLAEELWNHIMGYDKAVEEEDKNEELSEGEN